jgi:formate--tetrahydrofolate ligase
MIHPTEIPNDLQIARKARLKPLPKIAGEMGIGEHLLEPYGDAVAKIKLEAIEELADRPQAKYVVSRPSRRPLWVRARRRLP